MLIQQLIQNGKVTHQEIICHCINFVVVVVVVVCKCVSMGCVCPWGMCVHVHVYACMCLCVCMVHAHMYADVEDARCPTLSIFDLSSSLDKGFLNEPGARLGATKSQSPSCPYISKS